MVMKGVVVEARAADGRRSHFYLRANTTVTALSRAASTAMSTLNISTPIAGVWRLPSHLNRCASRPHLLKARAPHRLRNVAVWFFSRRVIL